MSRRERAFNAANCVTALRIVLSPCFAFLWWRGRHGAALAVFGIAGLTDLLDGFLARVLDQRTRFGQILDPLADKVMLLAAFLMAAATGAIPIWLAVLAISRDFVLASGTVLFTFGLPGRLTPDQIRPTRFGKYATFSLSLTIGLALVWRALEIESLRPFVGAMVLLSAVLTSASGIQYIARGVRALASGKVAAGESP